MYDGFISYSHAADGLLAPRLQSGLQRFAKPWWKRRALRVFRDESSLSANPHLWESITGALDASGWFVVLLSPDAAGSEWVNQEISYWVAHKDPSRILPVVTAGEFGWAEGDVTGDAVPDALRGVFSSEPRWVDLRFAKGEEQLDLQDPRFADAIADVASAMCGVPKDELAGEEVRQHRRTVRTAWVAGFLLLSLAVAAVWAGILSARNATEAQANAVDAARQATIADEQRQEADEQRREAEAQRAEAERLQREAEDSAERADREADAARIAEALAKSRELAAAAVGQQSEDPELAMLLALESIRATPEGSDASPAGVIALRQALVDNRLVRRIPAPTGLSSVRLSADGAVLYHSTEKGAYVAALDLSTGTALWTHTEPDSVDRFGRIDLSPDGTLLAVTLENLASSGKTDVEVDDDGHDGYPARVLVLDTADGSVVAVLYPGACDIGQSSGFSPDGRYLAISAGDANCTTDPDASWVALHDTTTWEEVERITLEGGVVEGVSFADDAVLVRETFSFNEDSPGAELLTFPDLERVGMFAVERQAAISPDGSRLVATAESSRVDLRPQLIDTADGSRIAFLDRVDGFLVFDLDETFSFSPDSSMVFVQTRTHDYLFSAIDGQLLYRVGARTATSSHDFSADGSTLVTASTEGAILVFDLSWGPAAEAISLEFPGHDAVWVNPNQVLEGPEAAISVLTSDRDVLDVLTGVIDRSSGQVIASFPGWGVQLADGRFVLSRSDPIDSDGVSDSLVGPLVVWDQRTGSTTQLTSCAVASRSFSEEVAPPCPEGEVLWGQAVMGIHGLAARRDGSVFAASAFVARGTDRPVRVWDGETLEVLSEFTVPWTHELIGMGRDWLATFWWQHNEIALHDLGGNPIGTFDAGSPTPEGVTSPDETRLYHLGLGGEVRVIDTGTAGLVTRWTAHASMIRGAAFSPDGSKLATAGEDDFVNIWDVSGIDDLGEGVPPPLLDRIPAPRPSDVIWLDGETIWVFPANGFGPGGTEYLEVSLDVEDVVAGAYERLTRGFEPDECAIYRIDDCPMSVEAMRDG